MIELRTLGPIDLRAPDGREVRSVLAQPKRLALLAYLAIESPGGFARRDTLLGLFWPESDGERARAALRQAIHYLRRSLGAEALVSRAEDEVGIPVDALRCDVVEFRAALARGDPRGALELYGGDLMEGFFVSGAPDFERWLEAERRTLRKLAAGAAWTLARGGASADAGAGDDSEGVLGEGEPAPDVARRWAFRAVELAPWDEGGVRRLLTLLDRIGDRAGAVRAYERLARRLAAELELEPSPETTALMEEIRGRDEPAKPALPENPAMPAHLDAPGSPAIPEGPEPPATPATPENPASAPTPGSPVAPTPTPPPSTPAATPRPSGGATIPPLAPAPGSQVPVGPPRLGGIRLLVVLLMVAPAVVMGWMLQRTDDPALEARRVLVLPFENRTGDPALDPVETMTADWIVQGLAGRGALEVVPVTAALTAGNVLQGRGGALPGPRDPRPLARETGAGTAVSGSFYRQGDSIHFQARVIDAGSERLIAAITPVGAPVSAPLDAIDQLRARVLLALAPLSDARETHVRMASPPTYEAYQAYVLAFERFVHRDVPGALRYFEQAADADSTFHMPAIAAAIAQLNLGDPVAADSIVRRVDRFRQELAPLELATLDMVLAWLVGDQHAAWEASLRQARIAPGSIGEFQVAEQARRLNRPVEAIQVLTTMGPERGELRGWFPYWRELADSHHMLGDHSGELEVARQARAHYPDVSEVLIHEVVALAARGEVDEVDRLIEERQERGARDWPTPGAMMSRAALELQAHGHPEAAASLMDRSVAWYRDRSADWAPTVDFRTSLGGALYDAGRWDEASEIFRELAAERPEDWVLQAHLGLLAARAGDRARAEEVDRMLETLDSPYLWGRATLWRARIAAVLGESAHAVDLLHQAFREGLSHGTEHHRIVDFDAIRDDSAFVELMRAKG